MDNIRGVNKKRGSKRRWGDAVWQQAPNGRIYEYRWLLVGSKPKGTLKRRLMRYHRDDHEWWPVGKWEKVK